MLIINNIISFAISIYIFKNKMTSTLIDEMQKLSLTDSNELHTEENKYIDVRVKDIRNTYYGMQLKLIDCVVKSNISLNKNYTGKNITDAKLLLDNLFMEAKCILLENKKIEYKFIEYKYRNEKMIELTVNMRYIYTDFYIEMDKDVYKSWINNDNFYFGLEIGGQCVYKVNNYDLWRINGLDEEQETGKEFETEKENNIMRIRIPCNLLNYIRSITYHVITLLFTGLELSDNTISLYCNCYDYTSNNGDDSIFYNTPYERIHYVNQLSGLKSCKKSINECICYGGNMLCKKSNYIELNLNHAVYRLYLLLNMEILDSEQIYLIIDKKYRLNLHKKLFTKNEKYYFYILTLFDENIDREEDYICQADKMLNMSRMDHTGLLLPREYEGYCSVVAKSYTIARVMSGMYGDMFSK